MFTNLYVKTNYSLLSSLVTIDGFINYALSNNIKTLAICDDDLTSTKVFYDKCVDNNIKPIIGLDIFLDDIHLLLYAKDYIGYQSLIKLSTIKSKDQLTIENLKNHNKNTICILLYESISNYMEIKDIFNNIYIGILNINEEKDVLNKKLKPVFINKILYLNKKQEKYIKYLYMIRDSKTISDDVSFKDNYNYPLKNEDILSMVSDTSINNNNIISDDCNVILQKKDNILPIYDNNINSNEYLTKLSLVGLSKRLNGKISDEYKVRLKYELDIIIKMGFSDYFLIVYDFIKYSKKNKILVGPGRGSAAGSLVAYCLGITDVDPIKYDLLFERFLNPERVTMPDIDTDFPDIYRQEVIEYVKEKYGSKRVSGIITFGTMAPKLALRDVSRILNIPTKSADLLCKYIPAVTKQKLKDFYDENINFKNIVDSSDKYTLLYEIASLIEGFPRHTSTHAAGVVMSRIDLDEVIPLIWNDDMYVSGYTSEYLEEMGLLKMDFLGIKNLTTIMNIISDIEKYEKKHIDFSKIPLDDKDTLKIFADGNTCGIFQFESYGMKDFLKRLKPSTIDDLFAAIALFRPGPAVNINSFIRRKHGIEKVDYIDNSLKPILESTYGIIVYQEQIIKIANVMAGFSLSQADVLRRAMSKKKFDLLKSYEEKFINGSINNGYSKDNAKKVYDLILNFANYGFNKSHSVCYAIVAYKMAYLKAKYPKYFFKNLLSSVIGVEQKTIEYINESRKLGLNIVLPDINRSTNKYEICDEGLIYPLSGIKNVGAVTSKEIIENRKGNFIDIYDCISKIFSRNTNKSVINASCFDCFGLNKKTLYHNLDNLINYATLTKELDPEFVIKPEIEYMEEFDKKELIFKEKDSFGFYLTTHPTTVYKTKIDYNYINCDEVEKYFNKKVNIVVLIEKVRITNTKNKEKMAFYLCSDETNQIDVILFPKIYNKFKLLDKGSVVVINGNIEKRFDKYQMIANDIKVL